MSNAELHLVSVLDARLRYTVPDLVIGLLGGYMSIVENVPLLSPLRDIVTVRRSKRLCSHSTDETFNN